jgi:serine/threonine protein kinase
MKIPARYTAKPTKLGGGMSTITLCTDNRLQRDVVVKTVLTAPDQGRLLDEIKALQEIRSAYVVQLYDVIRNKDGAISGIIEEYCPGKDLSEWVGKTDEQLFLKFGYQLISGIAEIHDHGVIHRDIKPHNVRVGSLDRLTIIDFGLSRLPDGASTVSQIGTSGFMAPELFTPMPVGQIDFTNAIDVFAFASSMYLLAAGSLPSSLRKRPPLKNHGARFSKLPFKLDDDLVELLDACWSEKPKARPTATELKDSFKRLLLRGRHKALINIANGPKYLDNNNPRATASLPGLGSVVIEYDGDDFIAQAVKGDLFVNAARVNVGYVLPGACVIAFGGPELQNKRKYVTFDLSHPGVEL